MKVLQVILAQPTGPQLGILDTAWSLSRNGAVAARKSHWLEVAGSSPASATQHKKKKNMKTKIEINYRSIGRVSLLTLAISIIVMVMYWDEENSVLLIAAGIVALFAMIGLMAFGSWKIDQMEREEDERERTIKSNMR